MVLWIQLASCARGVQVGSETQQLCAGCSNDGACDDFDGRWLIPVHRRRHEAMTMESEPTVCESSRIAAVKVSRPPWRCLSSFSATFLVVFRCCLIGIRLVCLFGLGSWISLGHCGCWRWKCDSSGAHLSGSTDFALTPPGIFIHRPSPPPTIPRLILIWLPGMRTSCTSSRKHYHPVMSVSHRCGRKGGMTHLVHARIACSRSANRADANMDVAAVRR